MCRIVTSHRSWSAQDSVRSPGSTEVKGSTGTGEAAGASDDGRETDKVVRIAVHAVEVGIERERPGQCPVALLIDIARERLDPEPPRPTSGAIDRLDKVDRRAAHEIAVVRRLEARDPAGDERWVVRVRYAMRRAEVEDAEYEPDTWMARPAENAGAAYMAAAATRVRAAAKSRVDRGLLTVIPPCSGLVLRDRVAALSGRPLELVSSGGSRKHVRFREIPVFPVCDPCDDLAHEHDGARGRRPRDVPDGSRAGYSQHAGSTSSAKPRTARPQSPPCAS